MGREEWASHYRRLLTAYNKTPNAEQASLYFDALCALPAAIVGEAINDLIRARGSWPHVSDIRERANALLASKTYEAPTCLRCGGNTWVKAEPRQTYGSTYQTVKRCPDCWTLRRQVGAA